MYRVAIVADPKQIEMTINRFVDEGMELHSIQAWWSHLKNGNPAGVSWLIVMKPIMKVGSADA